MIPRWLTVAVVAALLQFVPVPSGAAPSQPPLKPGTTWMYRYTIAPTSGARRTGTLKLTYGGMTTYRGKNYYYTEATNTVTPGLVARDYYVWTHGHFRQAAEQAYDAQNNGLEIQFDKTFPFDIPERVSGHAALVQNGVPQGDVPWSVAVTYGGAVKVTVPAGTFQAERWDTKFQFGDTRQLQTVETMGYTDLRAEVKHYLGAALSSTTTRELVSGPVL